MKQVFIFVLVLLVGVAMTASAETVLKYTVGVQFPDVYRYGLYTGEVNEDMLPDGFGVYEAKNDKDERYIIVGEWKDGNLTGDGWKVWENGDINIGEFVDGHFIKGIYYRGAEKGEYDETDDSTQGYTLDSILQLDMNSLDDESIVQLFTNVLESGPLSIDEGMIWLVTGHQFCNLNVQAVWIMLNGDGAISTVSYMMETNGYSSPSDFDANSVIIQTLINRINAHLGKSGISMLDGIQLHFDGFDDTTISLIRNYASINGSSTYSYTWDDLYGVVVQASRDSLSILFTAPKQLGK